MRHGRHIMDLTTQTALCSVLGIGLLLGSPARPASAETSSWVTRTEDAKKKAPTPQQRAPTQKLQPTFTKPGADPKAARQAPAPQAPKASDIAEAYSAFDEGKYLTALQFAQKAAEQGEPTAFTLVARIYAEGLGVPKDPETALKWYTRAAELGEPEAAFALGLLLAEGRGVKKNRSKAADYFEIAAKKGHTVARYNLALIYLEGEGRAENFKRAAALLREAAEVGHAPAQYDLGTLYANGIGVAEDEVEAAIWTGRAAQAGHAQAQLEYASLLARGKGVEKDGKLAFEYIRLSAEQGNVVAQNRLARFYVYGVEVRQNTVEGMKWHLIARDGGVSDGKLDLLLSRLTPDERQGAERAAEAWKALVR